LTLLLYVGAALVGALLAVFGYLAHAFRTPELRGELAPVYFLFLTVPLALVAGLGGAFCAVLLLAAYRAGGPGGAAAAGAGLAGIAGVGWLILAGRARAEQAAVAAQEPDYARQEAAVRRLLDAARRGDLAQVRACLDRGTFVDTRLTHDPRYGETALMIAARTGNLLLVQFLLSRKALPQFRNDRGQTPRALAEAAGHTAVARLLAEAEEAE
jgi:hypothetical protein